MKKFTVFVALVLCISILSGCDSKKDTVNYENYIGDWKLRVAENQELYQITSLEVYYGNTGVSISQITDNLVKGTIYSVQGAPSYRQAIVDFEGEIIDNQLQAAYEDEGWLYSGNIELTFEEDSIVAEITRDKVENVPMWGIPEGEFTFIRPIQTEIIELADEEKSSLEGVLSLFSKDKIKPFNNGDITDDMIINFVGINLGLELFDITEYGNKVKIEDANLIFDESVMDDLTNKYFGIELKDHASNEFVIYENGNYSVPLLGGVSEYPIIKILFKDTENEEVYYAIADYMFESPEEGLQLQYEYLIELQKRDNYNVKAIKEIYTPIDFEILNDLL